MSFFYRKKPVEIIRVDPPWVEVRINWKGRRRWILFSDLERKED